MKNIRKSMLVLSLLGLFIGLFSMVSCKKEKQYSCDQEIHNWAKDNIDRFQEITREQLATLPVELAQAGRQRRPAFFGTINLTLCTHSGMPPFVK